MANGTYALLAHVVFALSQMVGVTVLLVVDATAKYLTGAELMVALVAWTAANSAHGIYLSVTQQGVAVQTEPSPGVKP